MLDEASKYPPEYFIEHYTHDPKREAAYRQEAQRVKERIEWYPYRDTSILDVGCGTGGFLSCFDGMKCCGIDVSDYAIEQTRRKGIKAECTDEIFGFAPANFDVITMRGTIQHFDRPFTMLYHAYRVLKPGGLLAILATPNTNSLVYKLFGELPALDLSRNWLLPSDVMLQNILQNLGFKDLETLYPYAGSPYANPARDAFRFVLRCFGIRKPFAFPGNMMEIYAYK